MTHDSYKDWIDAMPIDDVRRRSERVERKLSDLRTLERLYDDRNGDAVPAAEQQPDQPAEHGGGDAAGGGWTHGEGGGEHG